MYLRHGGDYNNLEERDDRGRTPLLQMLESLAACSINQEDFDRNVEDITVRKTQILLSYGVEINTRDDHGQGCLHILLTGSFDALQGSLTYRKRSTIVVFQGFIKVLAYLIRMGADIHAVDNEGFFCYRIRSFSSRGTSMGGSSKKM